MMSSATLVLFVCYLLPQGVHSQRHTHALTHCICVEGNSDFITTRGLPYRLLPCILSLKHTLSLTLSGPENANVQEKGKKVQLWDREDASLCTINNPVKLCVAKAGSVAALSSVLTPLFLCLPTLPSFIASFLPPSLFFALLFSFLVTGKWVRGMLCSQYSPAVMLNARCAPFTFPVPMESCRVVQPQLDRSVVVPYKLIRGSPESVEISGLPDDIPFRNPNTYDIVCLEKVLQAAEKITFNIVSQLQPFAEICSQPCNTAGTEASTNRRKRKRVQESSRGPASSEHGISTNQIPVMQWPMYMVDYSGVNVQVPGKVNYWRTQLDCSTVKRGGVCQSETLPHATLSLCQSAKT